MTSREKTMLGIGALAGAVIGYWLNSDDGRAFRKQSAEQIANTADSAKTYVQETSEGLKDTAAQVVENGQEKLQAMSEQARDAMKKMVAVGDSKIASTQEQIAMGLRQAQEEINRLSRQLEQHLN